MLYFSNNFFKDELSAINWKFFKNLKNLYKYVSPFLFHKSTKIFNYGWLVFYKLRLSGFNIALLVDVLYHKKTIYYLNRSEFFTIGLVPTIYPSNLLNVSIPTGSDTFTTQLFFIKFLLKLNKTVNSTSYNSKLLF